MIPSAGKNDYVKDPLVAEDLSKPWAIDTSDEYQESYVWQNSYYDIDTIKYTKLLECDPEFEARIKEVRQKHNIPTEGYKPWDHTRFSFPYQGEGTLEEKAEEVEKEYSEIREECLEQFEDYNIPIAFKLLVPEVVISNSITTASMYNFNFKKSTENVHGVDISIKVNSPMTSCNKIKNDLEKYWPEIIKLMVEDTKNYPKLPDLPSIEIWNLRMGKGLKYKDIAKIINKKYKLDMDEMKVIKRFDYMKKEKFYKQIAPKISEKS